MAWQLGCVLHQAWEGHGPLTHCQEVSFLLLYELVVTVKAQSSRSKVNIVIQVVVLGVTVGT